jgi:hypothetical protein
MNIVGFGDSFILGITPATTNHPDEPWYKAYQGMVGNHYKTVPEFRGFSGTGPWNMFFDFLNYPHKDKIDVAIFAWSEISRIYHPLFKPINTHTANDKEKFEKLSEHEQLVVMSAKHFYENLWVVEKMNYEMKALMQMFDHMSQEYKHIKFIHLPCFSLTEDHEWWGNVYPKQNASQLKYYHDFKYGMEIRPALMWMSMNDEWPKDISKDRRECHMTPRVNRLLADAIIKCIDNYQPGKLIELDCSILK